MQYHSDLVAQALQMIAKKKSILLIGEDFFSVRWNSTGWVKYGGDRPTIGARNLMKKRLQIFRASACSINELAIKKEKIC
jgi:hypothetical protein